jgi:hypothetical protein
VDAVVAFFGNARSADIIEFMSGMGLKGRVVGDFERGTYCYFDEYPHEDQRAEIDELERNRIQTRVGGVITCAFLFTCHHGLCARFTLELVEQLMRLHEPVVLDDDRGGLWSREEVAANMRSSPSTDVYSLRRAPNTSLERTRDR